MIGLAVAFIWFVAWIILSPALKYHSIWYKIKAKIIFIAGDIRAHGGPLWGTTEPVDAFMVDQKDARRADKLTRPGDIGLHRYVWTFSNYGIPGAFKHAWIIVDNEDCVEATSDGVERRDRWFPMLCDYAVILRPKDVTDEDVAMAIKRAKAIVGCEYDANFKFDLEAANDEIVVREQSQYTKNISAGGFHPAFSCTETVGFSWFHRRDKLRLFRTNYAGRDAIIADDFLKMNFDVVWASPNLTEEWMKLVGLHEEGRSKISEWLRKNPANDGQD